MISQEVIGYQLIIIRYLILIVHLLLGHGVRPIQYILCQAIVFLNAINQAQFYVDLSTWSGNGLYFVHLIDPQNNTVTVKKIVLQ